MGVIVACIWRGVCLASTQPTDTRQMEIGTETDKNRIQHTLTQPTGHVHKYKHTHIQSVYILHAQYSSVYYTPIHIKTCTNATGLVCPSNGTCVNASTSHTFQSLLPSGEIVKNASVNGRGESSSILGPVIGAIVASLLVVLLLTAVIIIVCIVLRKRRWTCVILFAPPQPAGAHSNTEIPPDTVGFTQNPAYSVHNAHPHSPQRRQGPPEGREGAHSPPSSQRDNFMPQELRLTAEANRQDGGAIHLLMNLAYTTCNESHRDREDQLVPEGGSSPTQRHTAAARHNEDYIQLLPETANSIASERHPSQERSAQSGPQLQAAPFLPQETQEEMAVYYI